MSITFHMTIYIPQLRILPTKMSNICETNLWEEERSVVWLGLDKTTWRFEFVSDGPTPSRGKLALGVSSHCFKRLEKLTVGWQGFHQSPYVVCVSTFSSYVLCYDNILDPSNISGSPSSWHTLSGNE